MKLLKFLLLKKQPTLVIISLCNSSSRFTVLKRRTTRLKFLQSTKQKNIRLLLRVLKTLLVLISKMKVVEKTAVPTQRKNKNWLFRDLAKESSILQMLKILSGRGNKASQMTVNYLVTMIIQMKQLLRNRNQMKENHTSVNQTRKLRKIKTTRILRSVRSLTLIGEESTFSYTLVLTE